MLAFALATAPSKAICNRKIPFMFYQQSKFRAKSKESASHPTSATDRLSAASDKMNFNLNIDSNYTFDLSIYVDSYVEHTRMLLTAHVE